MPLDFREIRQTEAAECGLICLAVASGILGAELDVSELRQKHPVSQRGLNLKEIADIASALGMAGRAIRCELTELSKLTCPAILHWGLNHFVVLESISSKEARIVDPARGRRRVPLSEVSKRFSGVALELTTTPAFTRRRERSPLKLTSLFRWTPQLSSGLAQAALLSIILQAYVVASPFYMQLAIDEAALKNDGELLYALAIGFGLFALFNAVAETFRGVALQRVSALLSWDLTQRLFHHMIRLPLPWFQRRKLADALTRFDSLTPIKTLVANGLVAAVLDGALSIVTVVMMFAFAPLLASITLIGFAIYVVVRLAMVPLTMKYGMAALTATIAEQGKRIETLRAIQTIKVMAAEPERESDWANRFADTVRTNQTNAIAAVIFSSLQRLIDAITLVLIIFFGAKQAIAGEMTIGVLYAFTAYRAQFLARAEGIFEQFVSWRLLDLHTYRLADIALHPVERDAERSPVGLPPIQGQLCLQNVSFAYAPHEPAVLKNVNLVVQPGEFVAIVGPSGAGKSTLLKVLSGLYPASAGDVYLDGLSLSAWGLRPFRRSLGVVMQDDELLSGSIAENVAFFSDEIDMERVWKCLKLASIDDEINAMAMRVNTLVGDMGSSLSGGQKQRVLIARALYRDPKILLLDEASSHLDLQREALINEALSTLTMTRIVIAHRRETIDAADRVVLLRDGVLTTIRSRELASRADEIESAGSSEMR